MIKLSEAKSALDALRLLSLAVRTGATGVDLDLSINQAQHAIDALEKVVTALAGQPTITVVVEDIDIDTLYINGKRVHQGDHLYGVDVLWQLCKLGLIQTYKMVTYENNPPEECPATEPREWPDAEVVQITDDYIEAAEDKVRRAKEEAITKRRGKRGR